ncbi:MAG: FAD-dependent monooxygenase [Verrucomicrobia bacterium]|nr:FAD-dependent monooxygenase [Verrucomicrobiota bacterium]
MKSITIVGGGLAGLTLGIGLRPRGVPVKIVEAAHYPRHRVCGEFISGRGLITLERLGLLPALYEAGARPAHTVAFYNRLATTGTLPLPSEALCCGRFQLDATLAKEFRKLGGTLVEGTRWQGPFAKEGVIRATGRRLQPDANGWRWFGLKVHARRIVLDADLELHFLSNGYVGLCQLEDGKINICALLRSRSALPNLRRPWPSEFRGAAGSALAARLSHAEFDDSSFCSIAGLPFGSLTTTRSRRRKEALTLFGSRISDLGFGEANLVTPAAAKAETSPHAFASERGVEMECSIGDALGMIAPMTGNGMSMALESAELALEPLKHYSDGTLPWQETQALIQARCRSMFSHRLNVAAWLHSAVFREALRSVMIQLLSRCPRLLRFLFSHTR